MTRNGVLTLFKVVKRVFRHIAKSVYLVYILLAFKFNIVMVALIQTQVMSL